VKTPGFVNRAKIESDLLRAKYDVPVDKYIERSFKMSLFVSLIVALFFGFAFRLFTKPLLLLLAFACAYPFVLFNLLSYPQVLILKRKREFDKEVLFAGRYLLIKLESGQPLFKTLSDASKSYGISSQFFKEIVNSILSGVPIEKAIEDARAYAPSDKFNRILSQILTATKTGANVANSLRQILDSITEEQLNEIRAYGKKLNAIVMFYLVLGGVMPAIGMVMGIIVLSMMQIKSVQVFFMILLVALFIFQMFFVMSAKNSKPSVSI
jgi:pilus assembly protein TadC